jgi:hypothetical protein
LLGRSIVMLALAEVLCLAPVQANDVDPRPISVKPTKKIVVEIDVDTLNYRVIEPEGARNCQLCSQQLAKKYGKDCAGAVRDNINICAGLVDATVQDLNQIMLLRSRKNPSCFTIATTRVGGTDVVTQFCMCNPGERCPAQMWIQ